jgi:hypothetical protein
MTTFPPNTVIVEVDPLPGEDGYDWAGPILSWVRGFLLRRRALCGHCGGPARLRLERLSCLAVDILGFESDALTGTWCNTRSFRIFTI